VHVAVFYFYFLLHLFLHPIPSPFGNGSSGCLWHLLPWMATPKLGLGLTNSNSIREE
jgi:hypothetical protein